MTRTIAIQPPTSALEGAAATDSIQFVGNATVILRWGGFTILTDPNFIHRGEEANLGGTLRATRLTDPAVDIDDLPSIDAVVLSHMHGDHFDQLAEARLPKDVPIVTTASAAKDLEGKGFRATVGVQTWDDVVIEKGSARLRITSMPGRHGPPLLSVALPDVMGSLLRLEGPSSSPAPSLYISGDTLAIEDLREIPQRMGMLDVALLHLGRTRLLGLTLTMDAEQGVEAMRLLGPRVAIPIHYDDYDVFASSLADFEAAVAAAGLSDRIRTIARGEQVPLAELLPTA